MHIEVPHKVTKEQAINKIKQGLGEHRAELSQHTTINEERWEGDALHFAVELQGKDVTGTLGVTDTDYVLDAKLPLMWRMFEGRIEREIAKQVENM